MEELVKLVVKKTGLSEAQAKAAVKVVLDFLKKKLPQPIGSQIDTVLAGGSLPTDLMQGVGSLLGKKK